MSQAGSLGNGGGGGGSVQTINLDTGSISGSVVDLYANTGSANAGSSVRFVAASATEGDLQVTDDNGNTIIGLQAGSTSPITGTLNSGFGERSFLNNTLGSNNSGFGYNSFQGLGITNEEGDNNSGFGAGCFANLLNGSDNSGLGTNVGENYTGAESSNVLISNAGVEGESNQIRIGTQGVGAGQQSACAIAGITGSTITAGVPVYIDASGNLGTVGGKSVQTINLDSGSISGTTVDLYAQTGSANAGSTVKFVAASSTEGDFQVTDSNFNTIIGQGAGQISNTGLRNTSLGYSTLNHLTSGTGNTAIGTSSLLEVTSGGGNTCVGQGALALVTTGSFNVAMGVSALAQTTGSSNSVFGNGAFSTLLGGTNNTGLGSTAGSNYTSTESSNIIIGNPGIVGDSHKIRIGTQGSSTAQQNSCNIAGITGSTITSGLPVYVDSSGNLGTAGGTPPLTSGNKVLIQSQVISSPVTSIQFTTGLTGYDVYSLEYYNALDSAADVLTLQFSTNGGSSYASTNYTEIGNILFFNGVIPTNVLVQSTTDAGLNINNNCSGTTTNPSSGQTYLHNINSTTVYPSTISYSQGFSSSTPSVNDFSGFWSGGSGSAVNAFRLISSSGGNLTGTFKLYGIVN